MDANYEENFLVLGNPADPSRVDHDVIGGPRFEDLAVLIGGGQHFADGDRDGAVQTEGGHRLDRIGTQDVFQLRGLRELFRMASGEHTIKEEAFHGISYLIDEIADEIDRIRSTVES